MALMNHMQYQKLAKEAYVLDTAEFMDLVKSHLMFAVREEVEVLKEQIKELIQKNNQLEYENNILKDAAPQEVLNQLKEPMPTQQLPQQQQPPQQPPPSNS